MTEPYKASILHVLDEESGELVTVSVWGEGVRACLTRTDRIAFVREDPDDEIVVGWEDAIAVVGHRMRPVGDPPRRWTAHEFPTAEELARLRSNSADRRRGPALPPVDNPSRASPGSTGERTPGRRGRP